jgi:hypothetical protein
MSETRPPSAFQLERVVSLAMQTLEMLRTEAGLVLDTDDELFAALADENVPVKNIIRLLISSSLDDKAMRIAADQRIADIRQRRERFQRNEQTKRTIALQIMQAIKVTKFVDAEFTLSVGNGEGQAKVLVIDGAPVPDEFTTRTPSLTALKAALNLGPMPCAVFSLPTPTLTVRSR